MPGTSGSLVSFNELIRKKREGKKLTDPEVRALVEKVVSKEAEDCQIGAMLMAMFLKGMDYEETASLTRHMVGTGTKMDWGAEWEPLLVDKHSTGGVGDKVSLPLAPALAACGLKVPMMSGRGLDFTGGTLDKLESIKGFKVQQSEESMRAALEDPGCFIVGPTDRVAPADGELYKRRDVTSTVDSIPLIVSSIVAKKVAEGTRALVMDVKVGSAALFKNVEDASELAEGIIAVAKLLDVPTKAVLTRMDAPIGRAVGNALEVAEAIECMQGKGPKDLEDLVAVLGGVLLEMRGRADSLEEGREKIVQVLRDGSALRVFERMLVKQGVSESVAQEVCKDPAATLPRVPDNHRSTARSAYTGVVQEIRGLAIARACQLLGAGRSRADQELDLRVGVVLDKDLAVGRVIKKGDPLLVVHHAQDTLPDHIKQILVDSVVVASNADDIQNCEDRVIKILS